MRPLLAAALSSCALVIAGCSATSTGGGSSGASAEAFQLADGTYKADFPSSGCGTMIVAGGGENIDYSFGPCGRSPNFQSPGRFDGKTIRISQATYTLSNVTDRSMTGHWRLGSYSARVTFEKT